MLLAGLLFAPTLYAQAQKLTVAAAADVGPAFKEVVAGFEKQSGAKVDLVLNSSGTLYTQIQKGADYDLFFSSDREYPKKLQDAGLADSLTNYAEGAIVLWVRSDSKLDLSKGMNLLLDPSVRKISLANPAHAPYGRAAMSALQHAGLADKVKDKLMPADSTEQATEMAEVGRADVAITAMSFGVGRALKGQGRFAEVPRDSYPRVEQAAVILKSSKQQTAAKAFLAYLKTPAATSILQRFGFGFAGAAKK